MSVLPSGTGGTPHYSATILADDPDGLLPSGAYAEAWKLVMPECSTRGYPNFGLNLVRIGDKLLISAEAAGFRTGVDANGNGGVDQSGAGRVYAYTYSTSAAPGAPTMISSPSPGTNRFFGTGLTAYDAGGAYVAVGEPSGSGGTVHFFQLGTDMNGKVTASFTKSLQDPLFTPGRLTGFGAHLRSAGPLLLFGSPSSDDEGQTYSGGLYHFISSDTQPTP